MSKFFSEDKKKIVLISIYATIVVIIGLMAALLVTQLSKPDAVPENNGGGQSNDAAESFKDETVTAEQMASGSLVLVNKDHKWLIEDDSTMVNIAEKYPDLPCSIALPSTYEAESTALAAFNKMIVDAYKNITDAKIVINTAYRNFADQTANSATPAGESEFHTGLSFRLNDVSGKQMGIDNDSLEGKYDWLYQNAHKYGFIVRYPDNKSLITGQTQLESIFRYVGVAHATYMKENGLCLEEYLELLRDYTYDKPLSIKGADGKSYQVYYAVADESSQIKVSTRYACEISGDNIGGYIVTVNKSVRATTK